MAYANYAKKLAQMRAYAQSAHGKAMREKARERRRQRVKEGAGQVNAAPLIEALSQWRPN